MAEGVIILIIGFFVVVVGLTMKRFNPAFMRKTKPDEKALPRWLGITIYSVVGMWCIYVGLMHIRHR